MNKLRYELLIKQPEINLEESSKIKSFIEIHNSNMDIPSKDSIIKEIPEESNKIFNSLLSKLSKKT